VTRWGGERREGAARLSPPVSAPVSVSVEGSWAGAATVASIASSLSVSGLGGVSDISGSIIPSDGGGVGGGVGSLGGRGGAGGSGGRVGLPLGGDVVVEGVQTLGLGAVEVEPPVADEVVLVEEGSVGAEEGVLGEPALSVGGANVEDLALGLGVGVVSSVNLSVAGESGLGGLGVDWVVFAGHAGNGLLEHGQVVVTGGGASGAGGGALVDVLGSAGGSVVPCVSGGGVAGVGTATTRPLSATTAGALRYGATKEGQG